VRVDRAGDAPRTNEMLISTISGKISATSTLNVCLFVVLPWAAEFNCENGREMFGKFTAAPSTNDYRH
jgi:hypothetical protein